MSIQQPKADMSIRQYSGKLTIDQTKAWHNLGLKSSFVRTRETADHARQIAMEGLARIAREGDELMRIEQGGNPIAAQGERNAVWEFDYQPGATPWQELVQLNYESTEPDIHTTPNKPKINITPRPPQFGYQPGSISFSIEQYADLQIEFTNLMYKGYRFETEI